MSLLVMVAIMFGLLILDLLWDPTPSASSSLASEASSLVDGHIQMIPNKRPLG
jgi:hypothetical protein